MQVVLVMFRGDGQRRSFSVVRDMTVIGRREDCDLRIPLGDISRKHCRVVRDGDTLRVEDLGSSNGTFVNGERVQNAEIHAGDTIQVGPISFVLQIDGVPADEEIQPMAAGDVPVLTEADEVAPDAEDDGAVPTAQSDGAGVGAQATLEGEFDPMEALNQDPDESGGDFEFVIEEEQAAEGDAVSDDVIDLEESEQDNKA